jgi:aminoglycoside phosphotransferase (APT) family kinase protein
MQPDPQYPELNILTEGLNAILGANGTGPKVAVLHRTPSIFASTYPSEIVTCRAGHHGELKLYCKYMTGVGGSSFGHRGGLAYETEVYSHVLEALPLSRPKFYGAYEDSATGDTWLILEYLEESLRVPKGPQPESILMAARWIGLFHAANEARLASSPVSFLNRYDSDYYGGWVRRTSRFSQGQLRRFPWVTPVCERFEEFIGILLSSPPTIIHGEYYPHNVLVKDGVIYPIDWESAAVAAGEIDLAMLTEAWDGEIVHRCELEYRRARWGERSAPGFERRLAAARLYLSFRWLGERSDWTAGKGNAFYFEQLRSVGEELGFIEGS